jgi:hypothetical protein
MLFGLQLNGAKRPMNSRVVMKWRPSRTARRAPSPPFQLRVVYLVIERKPEPNTADAP